MSSIKGALIGSVSLRSGWGDDFNHKVRRSTDFLLTNDAKPLVGNIDDVRLDNIICEDNIASSIKHSPQRIPSNEIP